MCSNKFTILRLVVTMTGEGDGTYDYLKRERYDSSECKAMAQNTFVISKCLTCHNCTSCITGTSDTTSYKL